VRALVRGVAERVLCALPRRTNPGDRLILAYHNVVPAGWVPRGDRSLHLPIDKFEAQLRLIRREAEIVPLMELLTTDAPNDRRVAITFDDAYASALTLGVGACVAAGAACTVFVAPGLLGTVPYWDRAADAGAWSEAERGLFLWEHAGYGDAETLAMSSATPSDSLLQLATADALRAAAGGAGVAIGNHTMRHGNLGALGNDAVCAEVSAADAWLRAFAPQAMVPVLAYPFGIAPKAPGTAIPAACVTWGARVTGGWMSEEPVTAPFALARWNVPAGITTAGFTARVRGRLTGRKSPNEVGLDQQPRGK
jgi:peptidoglycan/xylan/chitin deacetylase (PgdA/CDA1 family)